MQHPQGLPQRLARAGPSRRTRDVAVPHRLLVQPLQPRLRPGHPGGLGDARCSTSDRPLRHRRRHVRRPRARSARSTPRSSASRAARLDAARSAHRDPAGRRGRRGHSGPTPVPAPVDRLAAPAQHRPTGPQQPRDGGPDARTSARCPPGASRCEEQPLPALLRHRLERRQQPPGRRRLPSRGKDLMDAYQYFFDADGTQTGYQDVGHMHWDPKPSHQHWHFEDFARYSLLDKDKQRPRCPRRRRSASPTPTPSTSPSPSARGSPRTPTSRPRAATTPSLSIREVLAAGWGDTYTQYRAGQSFRVDDLPNGIYYIAVHANPDGNLVESSTTTTSALRKIRLERQARRPEGDGDPGRDHQGRGVRRHRLTSQPRDHRPRRP